MSVAEMFSEFIGNLAIANSDSISLRYGEITAALNKQFRDTESKEANSLQVGSFGRRTGINGISDLDMLYIMPKTRWDDYDKPDGPAQLLRDTKEAILARYPTTKVRVDRLVVTVTYTDFHVEVQPVFEQEDESFKYPDTNNGGCWKITKPRAEMKAIADLDEIKNSNLRRLCRMVRAWKNRHAVAMGGLLIDTLAHNFLEATSNYDEKSFLYYDELSRDFFKFLSDEPDQSEYAAPGSRQRVRVKKKFQRKARKAHGLCLKAIEAEGQASANEQWKKIYGRPFPAAKERLEGLQKTAWDQTEEFIEDKFPVDIREHLELDCDVMQRGFRKFFLSEILSRRIPLWANKKLKFWVREISAQEPYDLYWKVLNRGDEAQRRNCIRGQIVKDQGHHQKSENTNFRGDHLVECYCVKDGIVIAMDRIHVPIEADGSDYD